MLTKIKRQHCLDQYQIFPLRGYDVENDQETFFCPNVFRSYILTLPSKSLKGHGKAIGIEITKLTKALQFDTLLFLGDTETPWLHQNNDYKPAKKAQEYLTSKKIGKRFNGALQVDTSELPTFIKHLTWLTRCNATLPYFHFIDESQNIVGNICKYGNLHLDTVKEQGDKIFKQFVNSSKFEYGDNKSCYNWFGKTAAILGRQTVV
jgi:hypothetical protein